MENLAIQSGIKTVAPRTLLEILVHGVEEEKPEIKKLFDNLESQMGKLRKGKYVRILWYIDKGELSKEEKEKWLIENSNCKYYVFLNARTVKPDYVKDLMSAIKKLEDSIKNFKGCSIVIAPKKVVEEKVESNLKIVE